LRLLPFGRFALTLPGSFLCLSFRFISSKSLLFA
jgi:hypothetical protein